MLLIASVTIIELKFALNLFLL